MDMKQIIHDATALLTVYGLKLVGAVLILIIGWSVSSWAGRAMQRLSRRPGRLDPTLASFLTSFVRWGILGFTLIAVLSQFGVETTSLIAVLGAASIAIGLALQGTLSHFASGVMLLVLRPFRVGDDIEVNTYTGTVRAITLFSTELATPDNVQLFLPNGMVWGAAIRNFSAHRTRRVDLAVNVGYGNRLDGVLALIREAIAADPRPLAQPEPQVVAGALGDLAVQVIIRVWVRSTDHLAFRHDLLAALKQRFDDAGVQLALAEHRLHNPPAA
ncbi:MAG: mechanosensitive ion channel family protein [Sphingomonadales bacterium]